MSKLKWLEKIAMSNYTPNGNYTKQYLTDYLENLSWGTEWDKASGERVLCTCEAQDKKIGCDCEFGVDN